MRTDAHAVMVLGELLDEALRMRQCPGIYFADEPSGRTAKIGGTGLGVWEVLRDYGADRDADRLRKAFPWLSQAQITAGLMYYARYRDEVQAEIDANAALTPCWYPRASVAPSMTRSLRRSWRSWSHTRRGLTASSSTSGKASRALPSIRPDGHLIADE
jgi:uncharacterized protein (DUF433 family)